MVYDIQSYANEFHDDRNIRTVQRMIKSGLIPCNHFVHKFKGSYIIEVRTSSDDDSRYISALWEFQDKVNKYDRPIELCAELAVKYDIGLTKLVKLLGV